MKLTVIYDNQAKKGLKPAWGFSCLVETSSKKLLFDVGWDWEILKYNMKKLKINVSEIDALCISHQHWDHSGALPCFLHQRGSLPLYVPAAFSEHMGGELQKMAEVIKVTKPMKLFEGIYSTGELGDEVKEQSLMVKTKAGSMVVCGCSHPGVDKILETASQFGKVHGIIGGTHGFSDIRALKNLGLIAPCHCTFNAKEIFEAYPEKTIMMQAGSSLVLE